MPASFQAPKRKSADGKRTVSQSIESNTRKDTATVATLLQAKEARTIYHVTPENTISDAVAILSEHKIGALPVVAGDGSLAGILSERDIVRKLAQTPGQTLPQSVEENMTRHVETCTADDQLVSVLRRMTDGKFRHMPVVSDGKVTGMVTIGDVVQFRLRELEHEALQLKQMIVG